jgi:xanthine dehydrogenase YagT iron-sulfur-binding subunit
MEFVENSPRIYPHPFFFRLDYWHVFHCFFIFHSYYVYSKLPSMKEKDEDNLYIFSSKGPTRREFLVQASAITAGIAVISTAKAKGLPIEQINFPDDSMVTVNVIVNGKSKTLAIDPRVTLLDALRENLKLTGTKKGCDRGQCGACTVLLDGKRINSCLSLAAMCEGSQVVTIEGLGTPDNLHPMQQAFLKHDAFQCGYCTPGQICSALGMLKEGHAKSDDEIREAMSGNLCRCGAYQNILEAVKEVQRSK